MSGLKVIKIIFGITFISINAINNRKTETKEISVSSTPQIKNVKEKELEGIEERLLLIEFTFTTKYEPEIGQITIEGEILYKPKNVDEAIRYWKKNKKLEDEIAIPVLNALFRKCIKEIINIAEELQLPPPIMFPVVKPKE
jgi:hypothetical protein